MKIDQKNITNMNTLSICLPPPSNLPIINIPPFGPSVDNSPVPVKKTYRMNLFRTRKLFGVEQLTRIHHPHMCRMSTTPPAWYLPPPPPDHLSGNHPEPAVHPRMN